MKFTLSAFCDEGGRTVDEQIRALCENGIRRAEVRSIGGVNILDVDLKRAEEYASAFRSSGIEVWAIGSPIGKCRWEERYRNRENLRKIMRLADVFRTENIRIFSFYIAASEREKYSRQVAQELAFLCREAEGYKLCHENEHGIFGESADCVKYLLDSVKELRQVFDPANFIQSGENMDYCMSLLAKNAEYAHIKDYSAQERLNVPAGGGDCKISEFLSLLESDTVLSLEPHLKVFDGYGAIDERELVSRGYESNRAAFAAAAAALKEVLKNLNFKEEKTGEWIRK